MSKRLFDFTLALAGLCVLWPLFLVAAALIKIDSRGPVFFRQERMGRGFQPFFMYKFRTMRHQAPPKPGQITFGHDPRITRVGRFLRKSKIDELPQLFNVLKGDMSLVGPRPELRYYVELFRRDYEDILTVRPGITDLASLEYRDEAALLGRAANPEDEYIKRIMPDKMRLSKEYVRHSSFLFDLTLIVRTVLGLVERRMTS